MHDQKTVYRHFPLGFSSSPVYSLSTFSFWILQFRPVYSVSIFPSGFSSLYQFTVYPPSLLDSPVYTSLQCIHLPFWIFLFRPIYIVSIFPFWILQLKTSLQCILHSYWILQFRPVYSVSSISSGFFSLGPDYSVYTKEEGWNMKTRQRSSRLFGGQNLFNSLPR